MTPQEIQAELKECLRLQTELETLRDSLTAKFKHILTKARRGGQQRIITEIDDD